MYDLRERRRRPEEPASLAGKKATALHQSFGCVSKALRYLLVSSYFLLLSIIESIVSQAFWWFVMRSSWRLEARLNFSAQPLKYPKNPPPVSNPPAILGSR